MSLHTLKHISSRVRVRSFLRKQKSVIPICADVRRLDLSPQEAGLLPNAIEYQLESPYARRFKNSDGIHFVGIGSDLDLIDLCINRIEEDTASVWVYLRLSDGTVYKFPSTDTRRVSIANENAFFSSGLQIKCLTPMRRWRVSYNGLLENCSSEPNSDELVHAKFSFIWHALSRVQEQNRMYGEKELTDAFMKGDFVPSPNDLQSLNDFQNRYEQWGQMMGTLSLNGKREKEFYFWSTRTRVADSPRWDEDLNSAKFYMYFNDGVPVKVETFSIENFLSNLTSGYSISPYGSVNPISRCNFEIDRLRGNEEGVNFSYVLNGEKKNIEIDFIGGDSTFHLGPKLDRQVKIRPFKVYMNNIDEGFGILHHSRFGRKVSEKDHLPPVVLKDLGYRSAKRFLELEEEDCKSYVNAGGKGSSLALLTELAQKTNEFIVPRGFVISTGAFRDHFVANSQLYDAVQNVKDMSSSMNENLKEECERCSKAFVATRLSENLKGVIEAKLENVYGSLDDASFSVRSSAVGEDGEELSAAGQMKTILGVKGINNICKAIVECWSSKFSFEAVQYARQNGQPLGSSMAVVIQEMVPSEVAGVLFTVDPVSGNPSYPLITANFGLGETVVSSAVNPDTIVLKRRKDQSLEVFQTNVGSKKKQLFVNPEGGTIEKIRKSQYGKSCLTNEWAVKIGEAGMLIEACFGSPRDIEWAVHDEKLYILQSRPVTALQRETDFELMHDQDTPVRSVKDIRTTANVGEVFSGALSPLAISLVVGCMDVYGHIDQILRQGQREEFCPYYFHILPVMQRHIAMDLISVLLYSNEKEVTPVQKACEIALFGRLVITKEIHQAAVKRYGYASPKQQLTILSNIVKLTYSMPKEVAKLNTEVQSYILPLETYTSTEKTFNGIMDQMTLFSKVRGVHGVMTFLSSFFNMMLMTTLKSGKREWDSELYSDFATLLSYSGAESVDVPSSLQELANHIASDYGNTFAALSPDAARELLENGMEASSKLFNRFLERHGHRCTKEFDVYSKTWRMDSESLITMLQNMVNVADFVHASSKEILSAEEALAKITTPLSSGNKRFLGYFLPFCRTYVCRREKSKSLLMKTIDWLRTSCYHLGDLMVKEGMLPDPNLVFFLTIEEVKDILDTQKPGLVRKAARRETLHRYLNEMTFPELMSGIPKPMTEKQDFSMDSWSFTLKGTPVCQGTVKGRAVVVSTLEAASKIQRGDILITYATDIGWSPYFPLVSGVVTVLGGLISHGAVVAREFGLPCVVAVENATTAFKSGDTVILNGTDGTITKVLD